MKGTVGVIGLGIMGGAIARNLAAAGWRVVGYDTTAEARAKAAAARLRAMAPPMMPRPMTPTVPFIGFLLPVMRDFAREAHDVGVFGNGSRMKFVANLLVAIHNVAAAEAMVLGMMAGLDPQQLVALAGAGAGASRMFALRAPMMAANSYDKPTMKMSVWQKDMAVIGAFAADLGSPTPLLATTAPLYAAAMEQGYGEADTAAVCAVLETMIADGTKLRR
jgi:3-hydroxyisobutyrate dehydrogenase-like beta-hydroxyacid dehydrogenase